MEPTGPCWWLVNIGQATSHYPSHVDQVLWRYVASLDTYDSSQHEAWNIFRGHSSILKIGCLEERFYILQPILYFGNCMMATKFSKNSRLYIEYSIAVLLDFSYGLSHSLADSHPNRTITPDILNLPPPWTRWPPFRRRYFQMHFREWKVL